MRVAAVRRLGPELDFETPSIRIHIDRTSGGHGHFNIADRDSGSVPVGGATSGKGQCVPLQDEGHRHGFRGLS